ncbi:unnamed protein product [Echinostoma caproni]|uniref:ANK_REP_REGION domain-containing protein n=1 Tax=Echinostoma caproni TaxID=27848 RepID=A0A183B2C5_9TREM|nr:unnamed protein product [Echinostoma caproni]
MNFIHRSNQQKIHSTHPDIRREVVALLLKLSRQGRADELRALINEHAAVIKYIINSTDNEKLAALHYAARNEAIDCVRILVEEGGADVNVKTDEQSTPLHFAARYRRRADKPTTEFIGATPLRQHNRRNGAGGKRYSVKPSTENGSQLSTVSKRDGSPPRIPLLESEWSTGTHRGIPVYDEVIHYLANHGAQLNGQDANGWTALHYAAIRGNEVATRQLLQEPNIDIEACVLVDHEGMRPLHLAVAHNETEIVRRLLAANADPFAVTQRGCLPVSVVCLSVCLSVFRSNCLMHI